MSDTCLVGFQPQKAIKFSMSDLVSFNIVYRDQSGRLN